MDHDRRGSLKHRDSCCQGVLRHEQRWRCPLETLRAGVVGDEHQPKMQQCQLQNSLLQGVFDFGLRETPACVARCDGMAEEPSRTPPQLSFVVGARAEGRTAGFGVKRGTRITPQRTCALRGSATAAGGATVLARCHAPAVPTPTFWPRRAAFLPRPRPAPAHSSDHKAWRPRAPSSPSTTTARP